MNKTTKLMKTISIVFWLMVFFIMGPVAAQTGWNLKLSPQADLTKNQIEKAIGSVEETLNFNDELGAMGLDTIMKKVDTARFFRTPAGLYSIVVVENSRPAIGALYGWCDVFVFERKDKIWKLSDFRLRAGAGGMYGSSGHFEKLLHVGNNAAAVVLTGGYTHMGTYTHDDIVAIENGKLYPLTSISTHHSFGDYQLGQSDDDYRECENTCYSFIPSGKENFDLQIIRYDCLGEKKPREVGRTLIPYLNNSYKIPKNFILDR